MTEQQTTLGPRENRPTSHRTRQKMEDCASECGGDRREMHNNKGILREIWRGVRDMARNERNGEEWEIWRGMRDMGRNERYGGEWEK